MRPDNDEGNEASRWVKWLDSTVPGRKLAAALGWLEDIRYKHSYRFSSLDEQAYRLWFRWATFLILATVIGTLVWLGWTVAWHLVEQHDQAQAEAFMSRREYREAITSARQTLSVNPRNVPACRIMAQTADLYNLPAALEWQERVVEAEPSVQNKLQLATLGLQYERPPFPLTSQILQELAGTATHLAGYQILAARLALGTQHLEDAETHFEMAMALDATNQLYALNLATLRLAMPNPAKKVPARRVLEALRADPKLGPAALRALVVDRWANRDATGAYAYATDLMGRPQATVSDHLQYLNILQSLRSECFHLRLVELQDRAATNASAIETVSTWMQANGLLAENIQWLTSLPAEMRGQHPVQLALAQAYMQNDDWPSLRALVTHGNWGELEYLRFALVSHASAKTGLMDLAAVNWGAAVNEAGERPEAFVKLLELAENWDLKREQVALLGRIVDQFPKERWAQQRLAQYYLATSNTAGMYELAAHVHANFPTDLESLNNLAATALLLQTNLPNAFTWAADVYARAPNSPFEASTFAYALHLQHHDREGLAVLKKLSDAQLKLPSVSLYYGLLLEETGSTEAARPYREIARSKGGLWPEEQELLDVAWGKLAGHA
jgi:hypothetical protein